MNFLRLPSCCLLTLLSLSQTAVARVPTVYPQVPLNALESYQAKTYEERLESMLLPRLLLSSGAISITMDLPDGLVSVPAPGKASARFQSRAIPEMKVEFLSFPKKSFGFPINNETLDAYLKGIQLKQKAEVNFKIIEPASYTETGPAKFRLLGKRAHTIRYSRMEDKLRIVYAEAWIERDEWIHLVKIIAPESRFELHFRNAKLTLNSSARKD